MNSYPYFFRTFLANGNDATNPSDAFSFAQKNGATAVAFVDQGSLKSERLISMAANQYPEIKPIYGVSFLVYDEDSKCDENNSVPVMLIAKNIIGHKNLRYLLYMQKKTGDSEGVLKLQTLCKNPGGLECVIIPDFNLNDDTENVIKNIAEEFGERLWCGISSKSNDIVFPSPDMQNQLSLYGARQILYNRYFMNMSQSSAQIDEQFDDCQYLMNNTKVLISRITKYNLDDLLWDIPITLENAFIRLKRKYGNNCLKIGELYRNNMMHNKADTFIDLVNSLIKKNTGMAIDIRSIPKRDKAVFDNIYKEGLLDGVFLFDNNRMTEWSLQIQPRTVDDISVLIALQRTGRSDIFEKYISNRKSGYEYTGTAIDGILMETSGVLLYNEQLMSVFEQCAGYESSESADGLSEYVYYVDEPCVEYLKITFSGDEEFSLEHPDLVEKMSKDIAANGKACVPKYLAKTDAITSYHTAWLKWHYPTEFEKAKEMFQEQYHWQI